MNLRAELDKRIRQALADAGAPPGSEPLVAPAARPEFGDYQANGAMPAAKQLGANPRQLAEKVLAAADLADLAESVQAAGPGFINIRLRGDWLAAELTRRTADERLGVGERTGAQRQTVVVDYSAPNIAKEMHVGHLRSTIIGDAIVRTLEFLGHRVIRQNHVGDWGRQFGVVILGLWHICMSRRRQEEGEDDYIEADLPRLSDSAPGDDSTLRLLTEIRDRHEQDWESDSRETKGDGDVHFGPFLEDFAERRPGQKGFVPDEELLRAYQFVTRLEGLAARTPLDIHIRRKDTGGEWIYPRVPYAQLSRHVTSMLQNIDDLDNRQEKTAWMRARERSLASSAGVYERLGVRLTADDICGESAYRDDLPKLIEDLRTAGRLQESEGALCVFLPEFKAKDGSELPLIVQKSDEGGYMYATTDLAAIRYRVRELDANRVLYVVDARQSLHFRQVFAVARKAGFVPESVSLEHVAFGTMMGADGKPFRTREGGTVKLTDLLNKAEEDAFELVGQKSPDLPEDQRRQIARVVGVGAVKYADLSQNRTSDYVFSWDKMLSLEGNTAPYMQYAYARVRSIFRKAGLEADGAAAGEVALVEPSERALGLKLAQFPEAVDAVARECLPNLLCGYLYDLAGAFMGFYESCPVLKAVDEAAHASRLLLCQLTARTIRTGLGLLGIETLEQM